MDPWTVMGLSRSATQEEVSRRGHGPRAALPRPPPPPPAPTYCFLCFQLTSAVALSMQIKDQWRRLCKQHHPDLQPEHMRLQAAEYFKEISGAYRTLTARESPRLLLLLRLWMSRLV